VPASACAVKPATLDAAATAAIPLAGLTALQVIDDLARVGPGQSVLVIGAAGGVGHFAVQIAKARGAQVTGVCGTDHVDFVADLGADRVVDYRRDDFRATDERYDLVFDAVAKHGYGACAPLLTRRGHYANTLGTPSLFLRVATLPLYSRRRAHAVVVRPDGAGLARIAALADAGLLRPRIEHTYALDEIRAAHEHSARGHVGGKLVVRVA